MVHARSVPATRTRPLPPQLLSAAEASAYHARLVGELRSLLGDELVGVYATGSFALGAYDAGVSDLDVIAVVRRPLDGREKEALVAALRHETLPCPARGLELVVYTEHTVRRPSPDPGYELDLNTGETMRFRASFDDRDADRHWYVIDRAITREHGRALLGPPPNDLFAEIPSELLLPALAGSIEWHRSIEEPRDNAVLNACRAWRFAEEGIWSAKPAAAEWARARALDAELVEESLRARAGSPQPDRARVDEFLADVLERVRNT